MHYQPTKPGFYWAKWRIADDGTRDGGELTPSSKWEVVEVHEDTHGLAVFVAGVEQPQAVDNFFWGYTLPVSIRRTAA